MTVRWKGKHMGNLKFTLDQIPRRVDAAVGEAFNEAAEAGVASMLDTIATTESSIVKGKDNRNDTGHMSRSLGSKINARKSMVFGWTKDKEEYFLSQEYGSDAYPTFTYIKPMNAFEGTHTTIGAVVKAKEMFLATFEGRMKINA